MCLRMVHVFEGLELSSLCSKLLDNVDSRIIMPGLFFPAKIITRLKVLGDQKLSYSQYFDILV